MRILLILLAVAASMIPKLLVYEAFVASGALASRSWCPLLFKELGLLEWVALLVCSLALTLLSLFLAATR